jgi:protein-disulfide isomerase
MRSGGGSRVVRALSAFVAAAALVVAVAGCSFLLPPSAGGSNGGTHASGASPQNMASDGIRIRQGFVADRTPSVAKGDDPVASQPSGVTDIRIFVDYLCPFCGQFEATNADQIAAWVSSGDATLEIHPISILDRASLGTKYSTRAANAMACVANYSPDNAFDLSALLFTNQPEESSEGLSDTDLKDLARKAGAASLSKVDSCIDDQEFGSWVADASARAIQEPVPGTDLGPVQGTPTVLVNGRQYTGPLDDADAFAQFMQRTAEATT